MQRVKNVGTYSGGTRGIILTVYEVWQYVLLNKLFISTSVKQVYTLTVFLKVIFKYIHNA